MYDEYSQLAEVVDAQGNKTGYKYGPEGKCARIVYPSRYSVAYVYDPDKNIAKMFFPGGGVVYSYDYERNLVRERTFASGIATHYEYDEGRRVISITHKDKKRALMASFHFTYDVMGNRTSLTKKTAFSEETTRYIYDRLYRLTEVQYPDGSCDKYAYDAEGNRLSKETVQEHLSYVYDNQGRLVQAQDTHYFYNSEGYLVKKTSPDKTCEYGYNELGQLDRYQDSDNLVTFSYNARGERLTKTVNGRTIHYSYDAIFQRPHILQEDLEGHTRNYLYAQNLIGCVTQGKLYYFLEDSPGSPVGLIVNEAGDIVEEGDYDAFGKSRASSYTSLQFNGEQLDPETGLIFLRTRYYDPEIGRFITPDIMSGTLTNPQSWNPYVYVHNNPLNFCDPWGTTAEEKTGDSILWGWSKGEPIWQEGDPLPPQGWEIVALAAREPGIFNNNPAENTSFREPSSMMGHAFSALITDEGTFSTMSTYKKPEHIFRCTTDGKDLQHDPNTLWVGWLVPQGQGQVAHKNGELFAEEGYHALFHNCVHTTARIGRRAGLSSYVSVPFPSYMETEPAFIMSDARFTPSSLYHRLESIIEQQGAGKLLRSVTPASKGDELLAFLPSLPRDVRGNLSHAPRSARGTFGGISLSKRAELKLQLQDIEGVIFDEDSGQLFLIGKKTLKLPEMSLDDLAVAIQSIYGLKGHPPADPGITIDEPKMKGDRLRKTMDVHYFGETVNTKFGRVLYDGDVTLKELALGVRACHVSGFRSVMDRCIDNKHLDLGFNRLWLSPETISLQESPDGSSMIFDQVKMQCSTEKMNNHRYSTKSCEEFASHFTHNYEAISKEYPIFAEVKRLGQITGIVKWMKDNNIPFDHGFFTNYSPEPCETPDRAWVIHNNKHIGHLHLHIYGGIELHLNQDNFSAKPSQEAHDFKESIIKSRPDEDAFAWMHQEKNVEILPLVKTRKTGNFQKPFVDIDFPAPGDFPLRLTRYYDSFNDKDIGLGRGWSLAPYELQLSEKVPAQADGKDCFVYSLIISQEGLQQWVYRPHMVLPEGVYYLREDLQQCLANNADGTWTLFLIKGGRVNFNAEGLLTEIYDRHGIVTKYLYETGHLVAIENNHRKKISLVWENNHLSQVSSPQGEIVSYSYDEKGSMNEVIADGHHIVYDYDSDLRLRTIKANEITLFDGEYDSYNRLCKVKAGEYRFSCEYNLHERSACITDEEGNQIESLFEKDYTLLDQKIDGQHVSSLGWRCEYDSHGLVVKATDRSGAVWQCAYSKDGDLIFVENPLGQCTYYAYDNARRVIAKYEYVTDAQFNSDRSALLSGAFPKVYQTSYAYNDLGRLACLTTGDGRKTQFSYDENGLLCAVIQPSGYTVWRNFDEKLRLKSVADKGGLLKEYTYDSLNRIIAIRAPSAIMRYTFDDQDRLIEIIDGADHVTSVNYEKLLITDAEGYDHFFGANP